MTRKRSKDQDQDSKSRSTWGFSGGSSTSDGMTTYPTTKFCVALVCWQLLPSFANDFSDCSVMLPGLLTMYQQIGSFGPVAKHKTASSLVPTGGVHEADLLPPGLSKSAETRELRWPTPCDWQKTDRSGDKLQRREAKAERFACTKERRKAQTLKTKTLQNESQDQDSAMNCSCERLDFRHVSTLKKFLFYISFSELIIKC